MTNSRAQESRERATYMEHERVSVSPTRSSESRGGHGVGGEERGGALSKKICGILKTPWGLEAMGKAFARSGNVAEDGTR